MKIKKKCLFVQLKAPLAEEVSLTSQAWHIWVHLSKAPYIWILSSNPNPPNSRKKIFAIRALALENANAKCKGNLAFQIPKSSPSGNAIANYCKFCLQYSKNNNILE